MQTLILNITCTKCISQSEKEHKMFPISKVPSMMTYCLDVRIQHIHKGLGDLTKLCSTDKHLVLLCYLFVCGTTAGYGL